MSLITCSNVTLAYENKPVISDLSFTLEQGDYLCIVGENGSGKSTLIRALLGLKALTSGSIDFGDGLKPTEIGYLPQQTAAQKDFPASVYEVVLSGCLNKRGLKPFYSNSDRKRADENIEKLGITELKKKCYRELSGGQQQRVLLARALCAADKLLLLDEPVTGLDPLVTAEFYKLIEKLNSDHNMTIIMVSHDIQSAVGYASHILHLHKDFTFFGEKNHYLECSECKKFLKDDKMYNLVKSGE